MAVEVRRNVNTFRHRPVREVAALLPNEQAAEAAVRALEADGIAVSQAELLHGPDGVRIFDINGEHHGYGTRLVRAMQKIGYDETFLAVYDEGLRKGEALLTVGCTHEDTRRVAVRLEGLGGHAMVWFGNGLAELLSPP